MIRFAALALALVFAGCANSPLDTDETQGTTYKVYFLGGQSNMDGYGFVRDLPSELSQANPAVPIFTGKMVEDGKDGGGVGVWVPLSPGHGTGFTTDGAVNEPTDRFGPELSFGAEMAAANPDERIAIIKYSCGGTGLVDGIGYGSWDPDYDQGNRRNQYDNALTTIANAMQPRDLDGDGALDQLVPAGIVWMQGEADAAEQEEAALAYEDNLARLMGLLRAALHDDELPVVIGRIKDSGDTPETRVMLFSPEVQKRQAAFVEADRCAALVKDTEDFSFLPDGWHYTSQNYVTLGEAFAREMTRLEQSCD